jgi:hypothetical protein
MTREKRNVIVSFMGQVVPMKVVKPSSVIKYNWATVADTAGLLRNVIKKKFAWKSGKEFTLTSESFSMGNAIRLNINPITWCGLSEADKNFIDSIKSVIRDGYWSGMDDMYTDTYSNKVITTDGETIDLSCKWFTLRTDDSWNWK